MNDPVDRVEWRDANQLGGNDYNPNRVFSPELRLLERSILQQGWIQPILINQDGVIVDGFHRHMLAKTSKLLQERYHGKVPCVVLEISRADAIMLTIRINRAKGSHAAIEMSRVVHELLNEHKVSIEEIMVQIGATRDEVMLLAQDGVFKAKNIQNHAYSKAWYPAEAPRKAQ